MLGATKIAEAAKFSKCDTIEIHPNEKANGPKCEGDNCVRRCLDDFIAMEPKQASAHS